jgi:hypothetical protein
MPPDGRIRKLMLFQVKSMSNLQKERLTMVGSYTPLARSFIIILVKIPL